MTEPIPSIKLRVLSLRYSSWSMRAWLALQHAGVDFSTETVELDDMKRQGDDHDDKPGLASISQAQRSARRKLGSVAGLFPVLQVGDVVIHESLAICEYAADAHAPQLWPSDALDRARARAVSCEMVGGFASIRGELSCHLFGRVPGYKPRVATEQEIKRVIELWSECLMRSGGPLLFGEFSIADAMYFPMLSRFQTYDIALPDDIAAYAASLARVPAVVDLMRVAAEAPAVPIYDLYLQDLGGDPKAQQSS